MTTQPLPSPEDLKRVLDAVFRDVLAKGELDRAERPPGEFPPWTTYPQYDERNERLEPEQWHHAPTEPTLEANSWTDNLVFNDVNAIEPVVKEEVSRLGLAMPEDSPEWRLFLRLALVAAARAHALEARRENGDYSAGFPTDCGIGTEQMPAFGPPPGAGHEPRAEELPLVMSATPEERQRRKPGPISSWPLIEEAAQRLLASSHKPESVKGLCEGLATWLAIEHPSAYIQPESIRNAFDKLPERQNLLALLCPRRSDVAQPHGHPRRRP